MERVKLNKKLLVSQPAILPGKLSLREKQFATEYIRDYNTTQAYIRAGGTPRSAGQEGYKVLKKPEVQQAILLELEQRRARAETTIEEVVGFHYELATADPRNLVPIKQGACRHCWGEDHEYQETLLEHRGRLQTHLLARQAFEARRNKKSDERFPEFDTKGGTGFNKFQDPMRGPEWFGRADVNSAESCPECNGDGVTVLLPIDMSKWSYGETLLFNGVVVRPNGSIEVRFNDRVRSMDRVAELRGFVRPRLPVKDFNWDSMSDDALDAAVEEALRRGLVSQRDLEPTVIEGMVDVTPEKETAE